MTEYLSIKEASLLTNKAEITIRRLVKRLIKSSKGMIKRKKAGNGYQYTIEKNYLLEQFNMQHSQKTNQSETALTETLQILREQLQKKDVQIEHLQTLLANEQSLNLQKTKLLSEKIESKNFFKKLRFWK